MQTAVDVDNIDSGTYTLQMEGFQYAWWLQEIDVLYKDLKNA